MLRWDDFSNVLNKSKHVSWGDTESVSYLDTCEFHSLLRRSSNLIVLYFTHRFYMIESLRRLKKMKDR